MNITISGLHRFWAAVSCVSVSWRLLFWTAVAYGMLLIIKPAARSAISLENPITTTVFFSGAANFSAPSISYTVSVGGCGTFDVVFTGTNVLGVPVHVGFFDGNGGIGVDSSLLLNGDERVNLGETLIVTIDNFTGCLTTQTGGGASVLLETIDFGRWGNNGADAADVTGWGTNFTMGDFTTAGGGPYDVNVWQAGDTYTFGTAHPGNPGSEPVANFPAISAGALMAEGDSFTLLSLDGNPGWDVERMRFTIIPEPSRATLLLAGMSTLLLARRRA